MTKNKLATAMLVAAIAAGAAAPAHAGSISGRDPKGDSGDPGMDVVSYSIRNEVNSITVQVALAGGVPRGEQAYLQVDLDTNGDRKPDAALTSTSPWRSGEVVSSSGRVLCQASMSQSGSNVTAAIPGRCLRHPLTIGANVELIGGEDERAWDRAGSMSKIAARTVTKGALAVKVERKGARATYRVDPYFTGKVGVLTSVAKKGQKPQVLATVKIGSGGQGTLRISKRIPTRALFTLTVEGAKAASVRR